MNNYKYGIHTYKKINTHAHIYTNIHTDIHTIYTYGTEQYVILLWRTGNKKIIQVPESIPRKLFLLSIVLLSVVFFFFLSSKRKCASISEYKSPRDP